MPHLSHFPTPDAGWSLLSSFHTYFRTYDPFHLSHYPQSFIYFSHPKVGNKLHQRIFHMQHAKKLPEVIPGAESFEHNVHSDMLYYLYIKSVKLFDDRYNSTRTYSTSAFTDSETKSLLHSYWMDQFNSHFYVIARHTHFSTSW